MKSFTISALLLALAANTGLAAPTAAKRDSGVEGVGMPMSETVNYIFQIYTEKGVPSGGDPTVDAYLAEEQAADPDAVLGTKLVASKTVKVKKAKRSEVEGVGMPMSDTVNYIFQIYTEKGVPSGGDPTVDAYLAEEQAADPAAVMGDKMVKVKKVKRSEVEGVGMPMSDTVNYIFQIYTEKGVPSGGDPTVDAYLAEEQAADPAAVMGEKMAM